MIVNGAGRSICIGIKHTLSLTQMICGRREERTDFGSRSVMVLSETSDTSIATILHREAEEIDEAEGQETEVNNNNVEEIAEHLFVKGQIERLQIL